ncbi:MAG: hypothetical protein RR620_08720 [Clostridium sp.]
MKVQNLTRNVKKVEKPIRKKSNKINIDFSKPSHDVFASIIKYEQGLLNLNEESFDELVNQLVFDNFEVEIEKLSSDTKARIYANVLRKEPLAESFAARIFITNKYIENAECIELYTLVGDLIPFKARKYKYYDILSNKPKKTKYKVLDLYYIVAFLTMLDSAQNFIESCNDEFFSLENYHRYFSCYNESFINQICDLTFNQNLYLLKNSNLTRFVVDIYNVIILLRHQDQLEEDNKNDMNKEYARAFETKKNIPDKILKVMYSNEFLGDFTFVELDELTDISKFRTVEMEYMKLRKQLDFDNLFNKDKLPELRFRRLGKHHALGMYFANKKCICVDIKSPTSFIHEVGHYLDLTNSDKQLSRQYSFLKLHKLYTKELDLNFRDLEDGFKIAYKKKRNYYHLFTEVFARCFELYLGKIKKLNSSLLKSEEQFTPQNGYPALTDDLEIAITEYFSNIITVNLSIDLNQLSSPTINADSFTDIKLTSVLVKGLNQLSFL